MKLLIDETQELAIKRHALKTLTENNVRELRGLELHSLPWAQLEKLKSVATREASTLAGVQASFEGKGQTAPEMDDAFQGLTAIVRACEAEKDIRTSEGSKGPRDEAASKAARSKRPSYDPATSIDGDHADHVEAFTGFLRAPQSRYAQSQLDKFESRTASGLTGAAGGHVVPEIIAGPILSRARDTNPMRRVVRVLTVASGDIKFPLSNADATSGWVGETDARTATTEPTLAAKVPTFGVNYAYVKMTEELANDSVVNIADWFEREIGMAMGEAEMASIIVGNGTNKPTGMLNVPPEAGADGTRTADAFKFLAATSATAFTSDELLNLVYDLRARYRANGSWLMNSVTAGILRKLKAGDGNYLWQESMVGGQPNTFAGYPVVICEAMPDVAADAHPIAFGDFEAAYILAQIQGMTVTAADQSITEPGFNKLYVRQRIGGCVYDENAARFLKMAAV